MNPEQRLMLFLFIGILLFLPYYVFFVPYANANIAWEQAYWVSQQFPSNWGGTPPSMLYSTVDVIPLLLYILTVGYFFFWRDFIES